MKYRQLTKEQFDALSDEFAKFLATQQIDVKEWEIIKKEKPQMAAEELNIFSDVVWEDVLTKTEYLDHISERHINVFRCTSSEFVRIFIKLNDTSKSFLNKEDYNWFLTVLFPSDQLQVLPYNRCVKDLNGKTPDEYLHACVNGPVFDAGDIEL